MIAGCPGPPPAEAIERLVTLGDAIRAALRETRETRPCKHGDPLCPCQDGDACHYEDTATTKAMTPPVAPPTGEAGALREALRDLAGTIVAICDSGNHTQGAHAMTPADIETLVALVERWQQAKRAVDALDYCDDALDREEMEAEGDLLAWTFPPPTDTPPEIQVGDVVTSYRGPRARIMVSKVWRPIWTRPKGGTT